MNHKGRSAPVALADWRAETLESHVADERLDDIAYWAILPLSAAFAAYQLYGLATSLYSASTGLMALLR